MKNQISAFLIVISIGLFSCGTSKHFFDIKPKVQAKELPESCKGLLKLIGGNIFYNTEEQYYVFNSLFVNSINDYEEFCFSELTKSQIKSLLGKPNFESETEMCYLITNDLDELPASLQYYAFQIDFSKDGKVNVGLDACLTWYNQSKK